MYFGLYKLKTFELWTAHQIKQAVGNYNVYLHAIDVIINHELIDNRESSRENNH